MKSTSPHLDDYNKRQTTSVGGEMKKLEPFSTAGGNVKWGSRFGKQPGSSLNIQLPYVPAILLPGRETEIYNHTKLGHDS